MVESTADGVPDGRPTRIAFAHANGYPPRVYTRFFAALERLLEPLEIAAPLLNTPPGLRPDRRWPVMLAQFEQTVVERGADVLVGHSMGGYLSLQVAARHASVRAVVLLDSPIPTGWRAHLLSLAQLTGLTYRAGPAPIAARRRDRWPSRAAAREHFSGKPFVQRWVPGVIDDFLDHALVEHEGGALGLRIPREVECDIYAHIPHRQAYAALRALKRRRVPVHFIAGEYSEEVRLAGWEANRRHFSPYWHSLPTGHLVPLEAPEACAELIADFLRA